MDVRKKLVELLGSMCCSDLGIDGCDTCKHRYEENCNANAFADHLIAHGVCLDSKQATSEEKQAAELPRDFGRWIPVEERKPDTVFFEATGKRYSEAVNVLTSGHNVITAIYDGEDFIGDAAFWEAEDEVITHWTPVLLPLPEPPKEVRDGSLE